MTDPTTPPKRGRGRPRTGAMPSQVRYMRFVADKLASGGRMMQFALDGETAQLLAHIRRRDGLKNDSEAVREAIHFCAKSRRRNKSTAEG